MTAGAHELGVELSQHGGLLWIAPFAGILAGIALLPLIAPHFWHRHDGKIAAFWTLTLLVPFAWQQGVDTTLHHLFHVYVLDYVPFLVLLGSLFTVSGGVLMTGDIRGTTRNNTLMLLVGTLAASVVGTTGASMLLIRPLIRANKGRHYRVHTVVFFIFLVSNIGGSLTPIGDPPLFLGFLRGVPFFWTASHLWMDTAFAAGALLVIYAALDAVLARREAHARGPLVHPDERQRLGLRGGINLLLLGGIVGAVLMSGSLAHDAAWVARVVHTAYGDVGVIQLVRDGAILLMGGLSLWLTPWAVRHANGFTWAPIAEVARLFAGIFACMIPALAMLGAGAAGSFAPLVAAITKPWHYFAVTGGLSSVLDNAPTYLVFFESAQAVDWGAAPLISSTLRLPHDVLAAISAGAVFAGALTYIGNGPNFMVRSIAESEGVTMPSFFGYILRWAVPVLLPVLAVTVWLFVL